MHRACLLLLALLLIVAGVGAMTACEGDGNDGVDLSFLLDTPEPTATPAGTTVTSDDGVLSIVVPDGAAPAGTAVTITAVPFEELPPQLREVVNVTGGYLLQPDGLVFSKPATATMTLDASVLEARGDEIRAAGLVTYNDAEGRQVLDTNTAWTIGEETATVTAPLAHLSWIVQTNSSLHGKLEQVASPQIVGVGFEPKASVENLNPNTVQMEFVGFRWTPVQPLILLRMGLLHNPPNPNQPWEFPNEHMCTAPATWTAYELVVVTYVRPIAGGDQATLNLTLKAKVECAKEAPKGQTPAGTAPGDVTPSGTAPPLADSTPALPPEATPEPPTATPPPEPAVQVSSSAECEHTNPGVSSEFRHRVRITNVRANTPLAGATVLGQAQGVALINNTASAVTDANGDATLVYGITSFGGYSSAVQGVTLADGTQATLDPSSSLQVSLDVGSVC